MRNESTRKNISINRLQRLGLIENPFLNYPDGRYFYPCHEHQTLYQEVLRIIKEKQKRGVALVRGEHGTGKSILSRRLTSVAFIGGDVDAIGVHLDGEINTPTAFVRQINSSLNLPTERKYEGRLAILKDFVTQITQNETSLFLSIDTNLHIDVINTIIEMADWQTENNQHMVQFAIFSKNNLFSMEEKRSHLTQYVGFRNTLGPLTWQSASELIDARVRMCGRAAPLFTDDALDSLIEISRGIPGKLLTIANNSLKRLIANNDEIITEAYVLTSSE